MIELPPGPDATAVATFIGTDDVDRAEQAGAVAKGLVDDALDKRWRDIPEATYDELVLEVSAEVYRRGDSPSGSSQYADFSTGQPVRGPRDPLTQVWPIIRRYVTPF